MTYQIKLETYEGPLDLLLYLIRKSNIDIYDIPIAEITAQYLEYLDIMEKLNLEIAGEFLVMASTLIHIKSEMLLPKPELAQEEEEDLRDELVKKLIEYEKIKEASRILKEREHERREVYSKDRIKFTEDDYIVDASLFDLLEAFKKVINKSPENISEVIGEEIKVEERVSYILDILIEKEYIEFEALFAKFNRSRQLIIATFIALLELIRQKKIFARQSGLFSEIRIYPKKKAEGEEQVKVQTPAEEEKGAGGEAAGENKDTEIETGSEEQEDEN